MPKLLCKCSAVIHYGEIPSPNEWLLFSDSNFDNFSGMVDAEEVYAVSTSFLKCPKCSRLYVFWEGHQSEPQVFAPE